MGILSWELHSTNRLLLLDNWLLSPPSKTWTVTLNPFVKGRKTKTGVGIWQESVVQNWPGTWRLGRNNQALWSVDGEGPVTDESGRERAPLRKTVHKAPFTTQVPSATCGAREGLRQRPSTGPIGCKISSRPSWIELRKWEIPRERETEHERGKKKQWENWGPSLVLFVCWTVPTRKKSKERLQV